MQAVCVRHTYRARTHGRGKRSFAFCARRAEDLQVSQAVAVAITALWGFGKSFNILPKNTSYTGSRKVSLTCTH